MSVLAPLPVGAASRVIYFGTPDVAVTPLRALVNAGVSVALVVTRPDTRRGRGNEVSHSPVKRAAIEMGLPIAHDLIDVAVLDTGGLLGVVVAYGRLIPVSLLAHVPMVNLHFSLLPRWRGAAPVERAILAGDRTTGACIMRVVEGLDTGDVHRRCEIDISDTETAVELRNRLLDKAIPLLLSVVTNGAGAGVRQTGQATYATKIVSDDLAFDWRHSAEHLARITRIGVGHTNFRGKRLNIRAAHVVDVGAVVAAGEQASAINASGQFLRATNDGIVVAAGERDALCVTSVQPEGKPVIAAAAWARGARLEEIERFGS